jgi:poly-beta-1,6-N-acetyl-D-glucosamine N-deacetylase
MNKASFILQCFLIAFCLPAKALVVLQYHHISNSTPVITSLSPELFKQHLDYLSDNDFHVITMESAINLLLEKKEFPDKSILITFDDGYRSIYETAFPMLKEKKFPFTVFLSTHSINTKLSQFLSWDEIKELSQNGATIANHTVTHPHLIQSLDNESEAQWESRVISEILDAQSHIDKNIGPQIKVFAYPYGEYNSELKVILSKLNYISFGQHSGAVLTDGDLQSIPRFPFSGTYGNMDDFSTKVNSLALPIDKILLLDENNHLLNDQHIKATARPKLFIRLKKRFINLNVECYLSGEGKINKKATDGGWIFQSSKELPLGRSRFNCTAQSSNKLSVYWYSQPWVRL